MRIKLPEALSLHETTVKLADSHVPQRQARYRPKPDPARGMTTMKVDPRVWAETLRLADGDLRRIVIVSATECYVRNAGATT